MSKDKRENIYFMGIGGTGMAAVAGLAKELGYVVVGSDKGVYPPMSDLLQQLQIPYRTPYAASNLTSEKPDLVVVANVLSRGNEELEALLQTKIPYTSFPAFLGERVLAKRQSIVVSGTHGKTTTTSLAAHVLDQLGLAPGFMIGGIPRNFAGGFRIGGGSYFVIEGDEYDTAFFDKGPKFLHYRPSLVLLNNIEFDHADIYKNLDEIKTQFKKLLQLVPNKRNILANIDDVGVRDVIEQMGLMNQVTTVSGLGQTPDAHIRILHAGPRPSAARWDVHVAVEGLAEPLQLVSEIFGPHNAANIAQVVGILRCIWDAPTLLARRADIEAAFASFRGVKRRFELLGEGRGITIYEDFAHHPTAMALVIQTFKQSFPGRRLLVAFEPANATGRRNVFQQDFARSLRLADLAYIGKCPEDVRIPVEQRMDTKAMAADAGPTVRAYDDNEVLMQQLRADMRAGDAILFMSPSSFSGIQHRLAAELK